MKYRLLFLISLLQFNLLFSQNDTIPYENTDEETYQPVATFYQSTPKGLEWNGYLQTDNRYNYYKKTNAFSREEYRLSVSPSYKGNRTAFKSEIWIRTLNYPTVNNYLQLADKNFIQKIDLDLREAYFDVYDFLIPNLDLRAGRQRIAWGAADKLNPTDNLNPYDLEDVWDFGRHLGSNSIKLDYFIKDFTLSGIFIPTFTPSLAPPQSLIQAFMPEIGFPESIQSNGSTIFLKYNNIRDSLVLPHREIKNSIFGFKLAKSIGAFNTSLSYMDGRDILPTPFQTEIIPLSLIGDTIKIDVFSQIKYPRMRVLGLDAAGSLLNIGVWAEAAVFFPEKTINNTTMTLMGLTLMNTDSITVDDKPYLKIAAGMDYTFTNGCYLNIQYLHGFIHEKGKDLNDYYVMALNCPLFRNKITLSPLNSCLQINDYKDLTNNYAFVFMPEITYSGIDNVNFVIGLRLIEGNNNTSFGKLKNHDEVFFRFKYSF